MSQQWLVSAVAFLAIGFLTTGLMSQFGVFPLGNIVNYTFIGGGGFVLSLDILLPSIYFAIIFFNKKRKAKPKDINENDLPGIKPSILHRSSKLATPSNSETARDSSNRQEIGESKGEDPKNNNELPPENTFSNVDLKGKERDREVKDASSSAREQSGSHVEQNTLRKNASSVDKKDISIETLYNIFEYSHLLKGRRDHPNYAFLLHAYLTTSNRREVQNKFIPLAHKIKAETNILFYLIEHVSKEQINSYFVSILGLVIENIKSYDSSCYTAAITLLKKKISVKIGSEKTLLHTHYDRMPIEIFRLVASRAAEENCLDLQYRGDTALHLAALHLLHEPNYISCLIESGASLNIRNHSGYSALQIIIERCTEDNSIALFRLICRVKPPSLDDLIRAIQCNNVVAVSVFLEVANNLVKQTNNQGLTPLHILLSQSNPSLLILQAMLLARADLFVSDGHDPNNIPLRLAIKNCKNASVFNSCAAFAKIKMLSYRDSNENSLLHIAASYKYKNKEAVKAFLTRGFSITEKNRFGSTPVHLAFASTPEIATIFLNKLKKERIFHIPPNDKGNTVLHAIADMPDFIKNYHFIQELVDELIKLGFDPDLENDEGWSARINLNAIGVYIQPKNVSHNKPKNVPHNKPKNTHQNAPSFEEDFFNAFFGGGFGFSPQGFPDFFGNPYAGGQGHHNAGNTKPGNIFDNSAQNARERREAFTFFGLPEGSTDAAIIKRYKKLCLKYHPDRPGGNEVKFKELQKHYAILYPAGQKKEDLQE